VLSSRFRRSSNIFAIIRAIARSASRVSWTAGGICLLAQKAYIVFFKAASSRAATKAKNSLLWKSVSERRRLRRIFRKITWWLRLGVTTLLKTARGAVGLSGDFLAGTGEARYPHRWPYGMAEELLPMLAWRLGR
jgi:hypothetical protein